MIENADPGFDFLFSYKIDGLITKYGGSNSHMAIRCMELGLPALIGVGDKIYNDLSKSKKFLLIVIIKNTQLFTNEKCIVSSKIIFDKYKKINFIIDQDE